MVYFGNSLKIGINFRINNILKNLMLKILRIYFHFKDFYYTMGNLLFQNSNHSVHNKF